MAFLFILVEIAFVVALIMGGWKAFVKAGLPGWAFIIPIYNLYLMWQMTDKPILWFILCFVPCVGIVFAVLIMIEVAKAYGQSAVIGVLMAITGIGWMIVGFGDAKYQGKAVNTGLNPPPAQ
jgi:hypothetical protein